MKTLKVVAAIILKDGRVFATQRAKGQFKGGWEFPGGKIEIDESAEEAVIREIKEELDAEIVVDSYLTTIDYDYPDFHLNMECFICSLKSEHIELLEHSAAKWLGTNDLDKVNWLEADKTIIEMLKSKL